MIGLIEFARTKGAKDKKKRKSRVSDIGLGASTIGATSLYGATTTIGGQNLANRRTNKLFDQTINRGLDLIDYRNRTRDYWKNLVDSNPNVPRKVLAQKLLTDLNDPTKTSLGVGYFENNPTLRSKDYLGKDHQRISKNIINSHKQAYKKYRQAVLTKNITN